jgi:AcrR family transcriptional regulator
MCSFRADFLTQCQVDAVSITCHFTACQENPKTPAPVSSTRRSTCWNQGTPERTRMSDIAKAAGLSRQAVYLHFPNRADLLISATKHLDEKVGIDASLAESRAAATGAERLSAFIRAWAGHLPVIYPVGRALMAMMDTDAEARAAWENRMAAVRHGCAAAVSGARAGWRSARRSDRGEGHRHSVRPAVRIALGTPDADLRLDTGSLFRRGHTTRPIGSDRSRLNVAPRRHLALDLCLVAGAQGKGRGGIRGRWFSKAKAKAASFCRACRRSWPNLSRDRSGSIASRI